MKPFGMLGWALPLTLLACSGQREPEDTPPPVPAGEQTPPAAEPPPSQAPAPRPPGSARRAPYNERADARADIARARERAAREHKNVLIMFGGNWCGWCIRLTELFDTHPRISRLLSEHYVLVHVDINTNKELAAGYGTDLKKGYPYLTVLAPDDKVITNQETGVLEKGSGYDEAKVLRFLADHRPGAKS
ncbi:MAG: hypothetical protein AMXMBFR83_28950 [Phycisphaerae bacterium]